MRVPKQNMTKSLARWDGKLCILFRMAIKGGVVSLSIAWHCNLDYDFMSHCLPRYNFRILDDFGWNFRHAKYHEENRRTLYKMYGIKVS